MSFVIDSAQALLSCFEDELQTSPNPPAEICLRVGEVPFDVGLSEDECCSGLAWVRVVRFFPSVRFPDPVEDPNNCITTSYAIELEMGVARCKPFGTVQAGPTCDQWTALALQVDSDAAAMRRALCCFRPTIISDQVLPGEWTTFGAEGGCVGGTMSVTIQVDCLECT